MSKTYWLHNADSDLTALTGFPDPWMTGSGSFTTIPHVVSGADPVDGSDTITVFKGLVEAVYYLEGQDIEVTRSSTGTLTVKVNVTTAASGTTLAVRALRVNSAGAVQATGALTATQSSGAVATLTFTPAITALGAWAATDRLCIELLCDNTANTHSTTGPTISTGTANDTTVASAFTGPPTISSATMADAGRDFVAPHQDIVVNFDQAIQHSGGAYAVDATVDGLTVSINGGAAQAVTYQSGDASTAWTVRTANLIHNGDTVTVSYARAPGALVNAGGAELSETTAAGVTNNLTARLRATLKNSSGAAITTAVDMAACDAAPRDSDDAAWFAVLQRYAATAPDGSGNVDVAAPAGTTVGTVVYLAVFNPREDATTASTYTQTAVAVATVT